MAQEFFLKHITMDSVAIVGVAAPASPGGMTTRSLNSVMSPTSDLSSLSVMSGTPSPAGKAKKVCNDKWFEV